MINFVKNVIFLVIVISLGYAFREPLKQEILPVWQNVVSGIFDAPACAEPLAYTLGTFDKEFGVSEKYFLSALEEAESIWEKPSGKDLFVYKALDTDRRTVKVNLIYDYRQQTTSQLKVVDGAIDESRAGYDSLRAEFKKLQQDYEKQKMSFAVDVASFEKRNQAHQSEVVSWNQKGGAPKEEYDRLQREQKILQTESEQLQIRQNSLNDLVDDINNMVVDLNKMATDLNLNVDKYNTISDSRGESFEEGIYRTDGLTKEIDIYEFSDRNKLVRVLAHELGHALGLDHVEDKEAIMYEMNAGKKLVATRGDLDALGILCGAQIK